MAIGVHDPGAPGRFEIRGALGAGGMGVVYRAFDRVLGREVALKTLRHASGRELFRFKREFRALADIVHPNLVMLHELHTAGDEWFFTMELVDGVPFNRWVGDQAMAAEPTLTMSAQRTATLGVARAARAWTQPAAQPALDVELIEDALAQLVDGVLALHAAGKLHRDLKPSNVLVTPQGRVVLLDFGLISDVVRPVNVDLTHERAAVGTPAYMSPEQAADAPLDAASDWYAVGVMLYEALTGHRPFEGSVEHILRRKQDEDPLPPSSRGVDPPEVLAELAMRLLSRRPASRPDGRAVLSALGRAPSRATLDLERTLATGPFVGRGAELAGLRRAYADARSRGVAVFVCGESGIGKTQVVRHFLEELGRDVLVLEGRCYERESVPYKTLDTVIDAITSALLRLPEGELADVVPRDVVFLARLFPVLRRVPAIDQRATGATFPPDLQELRRRAFGALRYLLARLAARGPVVIAIDDLQWGDRDSAMFLADLIHHPEPVPLLLVLLHRPEDDAGIVKQVRSPRPGIPAGDARTIVVAPLDEREARELVRVLGGADVTTETVVKESGGHPLFLAELARASGERQGLASLDELIARRIDALPPSAAALLRTTAAAARPIPVDQVARAAGLTGVGEELALLRAERLVRVRNRGDADLAYVEPYHDRIRTAAIASLPSGELRLMHEALAETFEAAGGDDDLQGLVEHWLAAGEPARAAAQSLRASEVAEKKLAFHRAAQLYAIAIAHGGHDDGERRRLLRLRALALSHAGNLAAAADVFAEAARGAAAAEELELDRLRLEQLLRGGQLARGLALSRQVLRQVGVPMASGASGALRAAIFQRLRLRLRGLAFVPRREAEIPARTLRRIDTLYSTASGLAFLAPIVGRALQFRFVREALDAGEPHRIAYAMSIELGYLGQSGPAARDRVEAMVSRLSKVSTRNLDPGLSGLASVCEGLAMYLMGRWREARRLFEVGCKALREHAVALRWEASLADQYYTYALFYLGETRELARLVPLMLADAIDRGDVFAERGLRSSRSNLAWLVMGRPDQARAHVDAASDAGENQAGFHTQQYFELLAHTQIDLYEDHPDVAWSRVDAAWKPLTRSYLMRVHQARVESWFLRARVALARAAAIDAGAARPLLREARRLARVLDGEGPGYPAAFAEQVRGVVALLAGDPAAAERHLEAAERAYAALDMALHASILRLRLGQLRGDATGEAWIADARARMVEQAIADPDAMARALCPWPRTVRALTKG